jgi:hypothetical protein
MKPWIFSFLTMLVLILAIPTVFAQKTMLLNEEFKANSISYPIKRKGINNMYTIGKYTFGPFSIVNTKQGMSTSTSGNLFKSDVKSQSKKEYSYDLVKNETDTVHAIVNETGKLELDDEKSFFYRLITNVDVRINDHFSIAIESQPEYEIVKNLLQTDAKFTEKITGDTWQCIIVIPMDRSLEGYFFGGLISYQDKDITILEAKEKEQNKNSNDIWAIVNDSFGYGFEFFQDGVIIAALQNHPMLKPNLWLRTGLDNKTQLIIASTIPVLISKWGSTNRNNINEDD